MKQKILRKLDDEKWLVVPGSDDLYQISNYGRVKSFVINRQKGRLLKCSLLKGYKQVQIIVNKNRRVYYVHKLVAELWLEKATENHKFVAHLDGNKGNNHISNLEWHTQESLIAKHKENRKYNIFKQPKRGNNGKLNESDVVLLKSMLQRGVVQAKIAKLFAISEMQVTRIKRGENWGNVEAQKKTV